MTLSFTKMHGLGNDFILLDARFQAFDLSPEKLMQLSRRDTGIGFDQCLVIEQPRSLDADFFYRIFNADGREVGQCGNGARCLARFVHFYGLTTKKHLCVETSTTRMNLYVHDDQSVSVEMPCPALAPQHIPLLMPTQKELYALPLDHQITYHVHALSVGNPHAIVCVDHLENTDVAHIGQQISEHPLFPEQTNVGFMQINSPERIHLRVYERGCGETRACGSGAVAAMAAGRLYHGLSSEVTVTLPGGDLIVNWSDLAGPISLRGPAVFVYEGSVL